MTEQIFESQINQNNQPRQELIPSQSQFYNDDDPQSSYNQMGFSDLSPIIKKQKHHQQVLSSQKMRDAEEEDGGGVYYNPLSETRQSNTQKVKCDSENQYYQDFELPLQNTPGKVMHKERSQSCFEAQSSSATPQIVTECRQAAKQVCGRMLAMSGVPMQQYAHMYNNNYSQEDNNDSATPQHQRKPLSIKSSKQQQQQEYYRNNYNEKENKRFKLKNGSTQQQHTSVNSSQKSRKKINCNDSIYSLQQKQQQQLQDQSQKRQALSNQNNYSLNRMQHTIKAYFPKKQQAHKFKSNIKKIRSTSVVAARLVGGMQSTQTQSQKGFGMIQAFKNQTDDDYDVINGTNQQSDQEDCNSTPYYQKGQSNNSNHNNMNNNNNVQAYAYSSAHSMTSQQRNLIDFESINGNKLKQIRKQSISKSKKSLSSYKTGVRAKQGPTYSNNIYVPLSKQLNIQRQPIPPQIADLPPIIRQNSAGIRPRISNNNNNSNASSKFSPTKNSVLNSTGGSAIKRSLLIEAGKMQMQNNKVGNVNNNNNRIYIPPPPLSNSRSPSLLTKTTADTIKNNIKTNKKEEGVIAGSALNAVRAQSSRRPQKVIQNCEEISSVVEKVGRNQSPKEEGKVGNQENKTSDLCLNEEFKTPMGGSGTTDGNDLRDDNLKSGNSTPSKSAEQTQTLMLSPQNLNKLDPIKEKPPQPKIDFEKRHIEHIKALAEKKKSQNLMIESERKKMVETRQRLRKMILNRAERRKKQMQEQSVLEISRITETDTKSPERKSIVHVRNPSSYTSPSISKQHQESAGGTNQTYEKTQQEKEQEEKQKRLELQKLKKYYRSRYATMLQMIKDNLKSKKEKEQREQEIQYQKKKQLREQLGVASVQSRFMQQTQKKQQDTPVQTSEKKRTSTSMPPAPLRSKTFYKDSSSSSANKRDMSQSKMEDQQMLNTKNLPNRAKDDSDLHTIKQATGSNGKNKQVSERLFQKHQQFLQDLAKKKAKQKQAAEEQKKRKDKMRQNIRQIVKSQNANELEKRIKTKKQIRQEQQQKQRKQQQIKRRQVKDPKKIAQANQNFLQRNMVIKKPTNKIFINDMAQWKKRNKVDEHTRVFICNGGYGELKKALRQRKWVENKDQDSPCFDLKWTLKARQVTQDQLLPHQIVNHFDKNTAITTKVGLCHNLKNLIWFENVDIDQFYPRGFDLLEGGELDDFIQEFKIVKAESILKLYYTQMKKKQHSANKISQKQIDENKVTVAMNICQRRCMDLDQLIDDPTAEHVTLVTKAEWDILSTDQKTAYDIAVKKHQNFLARINAKYGQKKNKKKKGAAIGSDSIAAEILRKKATTPKNVAMLQDYGIQNQGDEQEIKQAQENKLLTRVENLLQQMKKKFPQFSLNGVRNMWMLKPAGLSRGRGIQVFNSLNEILQYTKNKEQQWVVQKYIENPLIVHDHKFDIRQWVLVTDWNPLTIWFYNKCYIRFSAKKYNPNVLGNKYIHLTNNSILKSANKDNYDIQQAFGQGLMWDCAEFQQWLQNKFGFDIWEEQLQPQLKDIVTLSLKSVQDMVQNRKNSFEFFGYDFMVDDQGIPWLIEVNSSPAMDYSTEITQYLVKEGLRDTAKVIVDYHFASNKKKPHIDTGEWELIYKSKKQVERPMNSFGLNLFVEGKKILRS